MKKKKLQCSVPTLLLAGVLCLTLAACGAKQSSDMPASDTDSMVSAALPVKAMNAKRAVNLKPMEYDLFVLLLQNKNIALGREELLKRVWGEDYLGESRTVDVHIGQLRKKLELYDEIRTIPKLGYRLEE